MSEPEVWLRGPLDGYHPMLMPVAHSLLQVREDLARLDAHRDARTALGAARRRGLDRLSHPPHRRRARSTLTYARGEALSAPQLLFLAGEEAPGDPPIPLSTLVIGVNAVIDRSLAQLRRHRPRPAARRPRGGARPAALHRAGAAGARGGAFDPASGAGYNHRSHPERRLIPPRELCGSAAANV
jgi:hypothetical protein